MDEMSKATAVCYSYEALNVGSIDLMDEATANVACDVCVSELHETIKLSQ